jgi:murein DD-endopeptidase MepM/ murein hydrolase activator NlpD
VGLRVPVALRPTGVERLTTDTTFTAPLDSALAERVRRETARVVASLQGSHQRPRLWTEPFRPPRPTRVTSPFGKGRSYNAGDVQGRHRGTDFAGDRGDPVRAANRGVVVLADTLFFAGGAIYVDHGAGVVTAYLHLDRATVAAGDTVARGQIIGRVGATGRVTGPHLHWAAFYGRVAFDPVDLLALDPGPR